MTDDRDLSTELVKWSSEGAAVGLAGTLLAGPLVGAGAALTSLLKNLMVASAVDVRGRLTGRQTPRAITAAEIAFMRIESRMRGGEQHRTDLFDADDDGRSDAEALFEAMVLAAADSYEERKLPFLGHLWANLLFSPEIDFAAAAFLIRTVERVSYRQLVAISAIRQQRLLDREMPDSATFWGSSSVSAEFFELYRLGLVRPQDGSSANDQRDLKPAVLYVSHNGLRLHDLCQLDDVPEGDIEQLRDMIFRDSA